MPARVDMPRSVLCRPCSPPTQPDLASCHPNVSVGLGLGGWDDVCYHQHSRSYECLACLVSPGFQLPMENGTTDRVQGELLAKSIKRGIVLRDVAYAVRTLAHLRFCFLDWFRCFIGRVGYGNEESLFEKGGWKFGDGCLCHTIGAPVSETVENMLNAQAVQPEACPTNSDPPSPAAPAKTSTNWKV